MKGEDKEQALQKHTCLSSKQELQSTDVSSLLSFFCCYCFSGRVSHRLRLTMYSSMTLSSCSSGLYLPSAAVTSIHMSHNRFPVLVSAYSQVLKPTITCLYKWVFEAQNDLAGEVAKQLKTHTAFAADGNSIPSTHMRCLTVCNSISKGSNTLFWHPQELALTCTYPHTTMHIHD